MIAGLHVPRSRRHGKRDGNQAELVKRAEAFGARWCGTEGEGDGKADGVLGFLGVDQLVEIKNPDGRDRLGKNQVEFARDWRGAPVAVWRTTEDVDLTIAWMRRKSRTLAAAGLLGAPAP